MTARAGVRAGAAAAVVWALVLMVFGSVGGALDPLSQDTELLVPGHRLELPRRRRGHVRRRLAGAGGRSLGARPGAADPGRGRRRARRPARLRAAAAPPTRATPASSTPRSRSVPRSAPWSTDVAGSPTPASFQQRERVRRRPPDRLPGPPPRRPGRHRRRRHHRHRREGPRQRPRAHLRRHRGRDRQGPPLRRRPRGRPHHACARSPSRSTPPRPPRSPSPAAPSARWRATCPPQRLRAGSAASAV